MEKLQSYIDQKMVYLQKESIKDAIKQMIAQAYGHNQNTLGQKLL